MKICFLTNNLKQDNGAGVFSSRVINGLKKELNAEPIIFTSEQYPKLWREFFTIRSEIKKCDVIHALDGYPYGVISYLASLGLRKKLIITAIGSGAIIYLYKPFNAFCLKRAYRAADRVIAISKFTRDEILKKVPDLKMEVINHGVDYEKFIGERNIVLPKAQILQDLAQSRPYILSVGSLRWRKGYHRSLPAFAEVSKVFPNLKYVIVGKRYQDDYYNRLKLEIRNLKLEEKVVILDNIDDENALTRLYRNAELFCLMPQTAGHDLEGFGIVFLEAAAAGLPVVGTSGSGAEDAVSDGKNGILLDDPRDSKGFADAIIKILSDGNLKKSMSQNSLEWVQKFSWDSKIADYVKIYEGLL